MIEILCKSSSWYLLFRASSLFNDLISKVQIVEKDGKTNTYSFKNINTNEVKMEDFKFDIPEGVTVDDQRVK